jgi:predicted HTH transcriptional regulator
MINKRLLIKNLLSNNDENSFYDKKQKLSLHNKEGKAKFIKHVCALSNSNPTNNSYIVIGIEDEENTADRVTSGAGSDIGAYGFTNAVSISLPKPPATIRASVQ